MISQFILGQSHYGVGGEETQRNKHIQSLINKSFVYSELLFLCLPSLCSLELNIDHYFAMSGIHVLKFSSQENVHQGLVYNVSG